MWYTCKSGLILVTPAHLLSTVIVMESFAVSLSISLFNLSATVTLHVNMVSMVLRGERARIEFVEKDGELIEIRPLEDMVLFSLSLQMKENINSPLSTTSRSSMVEQMIITSFTIPATKDSEKTERDTSGAETTANTR